MILLSFTTRCILFLLTIILSSGRSHLEEAVYSSEAQMEVEWATQNDVNLLSFRSIYQLENVTARYLQGLLDHAEVTNVEYMDGTDAITTNVDAVDLQLTDDMFTMISRVQVTYIAEEPIQDLASILIFLTRQDTANGLMIRMFEVLGSGAASMTVNFRTEGASIRLVELDPDHIHGRSVADQGLILACALLCVALIVVSGVLLYVVGGWRDLRDQIEEQFDWFKNYTVSTSQDETEEKDRGSFEQQEGSPSARSGRSGVSVRSGRSGGVPREASDDSGIVDTASKSDTAMSSLSTTVNKIYNPSAGLGFTQTPERGIYEDDNAITPYSTDTTYTDTSRANLGITSMRKMRDVNHPPNTTQKMMEMSQFRMPYNNNP